MIFPNGCNGDMHIDVLTIENEKRYSLAQFAIHYIIFRT